MIMDNGENVHELAREIAESDRALTTRDVITNIILEAFNNGLLNNHALSVRGMCVMQCERRYDRLTITANGKTATVLIHETDDQTIRRKIITGLVAQFV